MPSGIISNVNREKNFAFIKPDAGTTDVYVRLSDLNDQDIADIERGCKVTFRAIAVTGRMYAHGLRIVEKPQTKYPVRIVENSRAAECTIGEETAISASSRSFFHSGDGAKKERRRQIKDSH